MRSIPQDNLRVAGRLREAASLLHGQGASRHREKAYRAAADAIARLPRNVRGLYEHEGVRGLDAIPGVGLGIACAVGEMLATGHWAQLDLLRDSAGTATAPGGTPHARRRLVSDPAVNEPPAALLLDVDSEYREKALTVLHATRDAWHFTALHSNTALARRLGRTRDWIVIHYHDGGPGEHRATVVTELRGELRGRRIVRGREEECRAHYAAREMEESR